MNKHVLSSLLMLAVGVSGFAQQRGPAHRNIMEAAPHQTVGTTQVVNPIINANELSNHPTNVSVRGGCPPVLLSEDFQTEVIPATWYNLDTDGLTDANARPEDWYIGFDDQSTTAGDTNWVARASSWFNPAGTSNNWLIMDPVTICDVNTVLSWESSPFEGLPYVDGYKVMLSPTGSFLPNAFTVTLATFAETNGSGVWSGTGIHHTAFNGNRGVLQEWQVALASYIGTTVRIAFVHQTIDDNLLNLDNIFIGTSVPYDLEANNVDRGTEYFLIPAAQVHPVTPSGDLRNVGVVSVTNPTLKFDIIDGALTNQFSNTQGQSSLAGGVAQSFTAGASYTPAMVEEVYAVVGTADGDELDPDLTNNTDTAYFVVTDTIYSRETGTPDGALSIGVGSSGTMCNTFEIFATDYATSISVFLSDPTVGDSLVARIYNMAGGVPTTLLASSDLFIVTSANAGLITLPLLGGPILLPVGSYAVGLHEYVTASATLGTEAASYAAGGSWVLYQGTWSNPADFGFAVAFTVRLNLVSSLTTGLSDRPSENGLTLYPNPNDGTFTITLPTTIDDNINVRVFDMSGRVVLDESFSSNGGANLSLNTELPQGIYLIQVISNDQSFTKKVVVRD